MTNSNDDKLNIQLLMSIDQAQVVSKGLDILSRLGTGQLEIISELIEDGLIHLAGESSEPVRNADIDTYQEIREHIYAIKSLLGYPARGSNGISHGHNDKTTLRAYEGHKVLAKALVEHRTPSDRGVDSQGLVVRYLNEPAPKASLIPLAE